MFSLHDVTKRRTKDAVGPDAAAGLVDYLSFLFTYSLMQNILSCLLVMNTPQLQGMVCKVQYVFREYGGEVAEW